MNIQLITVLLWIIMIVVFGGQYVIGKVSVHTWLLFCIPIIWLGAVVILAIYGYMNSFRDYFLAVFEFFMLLNVGARGHKHRKKGGE